MVWHRDGGAVPVSFPVLLSDPGHGVGVPLLEMICLDHPMDVAFRVRS